MPAKLFTLLLAGATLFTASPAHSDSVLRCEDAKGRPIFTDDPRRCRHRDTETVTVKLQNSHGQFGLTESKEYYNYANRAHTELQGYGIRIIVESELLAQNPELAHACARRLQQKVQQALALMPSAHRAQFAGIRFYLFNGSQSSYGGKDSGLWYFSKKNRISERFNDSIIINSAQRFLNLSEAHALAVTIHELAHGFNHYNRARFWREQRAAYNNTLTQKRYQKPGKTPTDKPWKAYALTNEKEYFAELSAMFFARLNHAPFDRAGLATYDPEGFALMERAWLTKETEQTVSTDKNR